MSQEAISTLDQRYGLSRTTVNKWCGRTTTAGVRWRLTTLHSTVLALDDVRGCLRDTIPKLARHSLAWRQHVPARHPHRAGRRRHGLRRPAEPVAAAPRWRPCSAATSSTASARSMASRTNSRALSPVDRRPGRTHEPHRQGSYNQGVPLSGPRQPRSPHPGAHLSLLRHAPQTTRLKTPFEAICQAWTKTPSPHPGTRHPDLFSTEKPRSLQFGTSLTRLLADLEQDLPRRG